MKRHEYWRQQYRGNRYLRHLRIEELHQRGRETFNINLTLTLERQIGLLNFQDFGSEAMERWTHYLEECNLGEIDYKQGMKDLRVQEAVPNLLGDLGRRAATALKAADQVQKAILVKFGKARCLGPLLVEGKLRIQPASSFADPRHNNAVGNNEISRAFKLAISGEDILPLLTEHGLSREMAEPDSLGPVEIHGELMTAAAR